MLLIVPVTLLITDELEVSPYPFLVAEVFASNIGGAATLIGDPPNIMIGSAVRLTFNDFVLNLAPITPPILAVTLAVLYFIYGRGMEAGDERRAHVMRFREREAITDVPLLKKSLTVLGLVIAAFVFAHPLRLEPATIAMFGAALLLLATNLGAGAGAQSENVHKRFGEVEWVTIFFFVGLFIVVHGVEHAGGLDILARWVLDTTGGDLAATALAILWISAIASAVVDNIPFVAAMIPLIESMAPGFGGAGCDNSSTRPGLLPVKSSTKRRRFFRQPAFGFRLRRVGEIEHSRSYGPCPGVGGNLPVMPGRDEYPSLRGDMMRSFRIPISTRSCRMPYREASARTGPGF